MTHLDEELSLLKLEVIEMMTLARNQLEKAMNAFLNSDIELSEEIAHNEKRVNAMELSIDRKCENILALYRPVATDLRFVISVLKINSDIERIGDIANSIASYVQDIGSKIPRESIDETKIAEMFNTNLMMLDDLLRAYENDDTKLARKVYKQDRKLNKINKGSSKKIAKLIQGNPNQSSQHLFLFSAIRKLERTGDHIKNITEDIIFHIDAKVLKHKKDKSKSK